MAKETPRSETPGEESEVVFSSDFSDSRPPEDGGEEVEKNNPDTEEFAVDIKSLDSQHIDETEDLSSSGEEGGEEYLLDLRNGSGNSVTNVSLGDTGRNTLEARKFSSMTIKEILERKEELKNTPPGESVAISKVVGLPTAGSQSDDIYLQSFASGFRVGGDTGYSAELLNDGVFVVSPAEFGHLHDKDGSVSVEKLAKRIFDNTSFIKKMEAEGSRDVKLSGNDIDLVLVDEEHTEDHYTDSEIVESMRVGSKRRDPKSYSTRSFSVKNSGVTEDVLANVNDRLFSDKIRHKFWRLKKKIAASF
ncbi:hypothetical protein C0581_02155 [Candidatus Parcubacteria bacterium]|nr:MAG: hypothetical protein C0581_02155 [Candidatus Parcubacteria bacterium]